MRTLTSEIKAQAGQRVSLQGWLHKKRDIGGVMFIILRDRGGLAQVVVNDQTEQAKLGGLQVGTVIEVEGLVKADERAMGGAELHEPKITVLVPVEAVPPIEIDKPLSHEPDNLDTLFEYRAIGLRNQHETAIFRVRAALTKALRDFFYSQNFTEVQTPKLLAAATEGGAEVFKIDYFGKEATLAQSPQFYKQILVGIFERVFEIAPVYRAEPSATTRHMTEYTSVDGELGFIDLQGLEELLGDLLHSVIESVWKDCVFELELLKAKKPVVAKSIPKYSIDQIHELYTKATGTKTTGEKDLRPDEERWICKHAAEHDQSEAVFVTDWPASDMKFYHKASESNAEVADRIDLLFRGVEIVTGSTREHRYDVLLKQFKEHVKDGDPTDPGFKGLFMAMEAGMPPHAGFGLGLDRLTQQLLGLGNIKEATLFPRDMNRLAP